MLFKDALRYMRRGWEVHTYDWEDWDSKSIALVEGKIVEVHNNGSTSPYKLTEKDKESELWGLVVITEKYRPDCLVCDDIAQQPKLTNLL